MTALATSVSIQNLWVDLDEFHLHNLSLQVQCGEYFCILGPTGAGKTILLETIAGLHRAQRGRILLDGVDVTRMPPERRGIGFVYQDYALFPHLSVADNIAFGLSMQQRPQAEKQRRVEDMAALLGIEGLLHRKPDTLSGGEQQRVALARALVVQPRLLLLDEPLSALDPGTREQLQRQMIRLHRELGTTQIHVTHDFEEAVALGQRIAVIDDGRLLQVGTPEDIFRRPESAFVAQFVGVRNVFAGRVEPGTDHGQEIFVLDGLRLAVLADQPGEAHISLRPEDIVLSQAPLHSSARNCIQGRVRDIVDRGTLIYVTVDVPPAFVCAITHASLEEMAIQEGTTVYLSFKASAVHVF